MESLKTPEPVQPASPPVPEHRARASMLAILVSALTGTASEIFLKVGAAETAGHSVFGLSWLGFSGLESRSVWLAILFTILSFVAWVRAIRVVPLSLAFTFANVVHIFVPLSCWLILGETISPRRWVGIGLVLVGLMVIARPFAQLDEKLDEAL